MSNSYTNWTSLLAVRVSKAATEAGLGMISDSAAITSPQELRTTTPIPTASRSSNTTPSKFVFTVLGLGGFPNCWFGWLLHYGMFFLLLEFLKIMHCLGGEFIQRNYRIISSAFVAMIPNGPTDHDKEFRSSWAQSCQPKEIREGESLNVCSPQIIELPPPDLADFLTTPQSMNNIFRLSLAIAASGGARI